MYTPSETPIATVTIPLTLKEWTDLGVLIPSGDRCFILATGSGIVSHFGVPTPVTPAGSTPPTDITGEYGNFGFWAAQVLDNLPGNASGLCLAIAAQSAILNPIARDLEWTSLRRIFCPGNNALFELENLQPSGVRLYAQINALGTYYPQNSGSFTVKVYAAQVEPPPPPIISATGVLDNNTQKNRLSIS